jgi:hypothetical protein
MKRIVRKWIPEWIPKLPPLRIPSKISSKLKMKFLLAASILFTPALSFGLVKPLSFNRPSLRALNGRNFDFDGDDVGRQFGKSIDKGW